MSLPEVAGIETEYAILLRGAERSDPFTASALLLAHCPQAGRRPPAADGDYCDGFMLPNGGRFYIDHAHPEYCTPEAATPRGVVAADKAGEVFLERCRQRANAGGGLPPGQEIVLYKNNSDQCGTSYGCHENYLVAPATFEALVRRGGAPGPAQATLLAFLVTRPLLCGAGKVGAENGTPPVPFQLSQRADFFETLVGPQTTHRRPLLNTRDEPHADPRRFRRLHVIVGDANLAEYSTYLKVGTTQLVLRMIADGFLGPDLAVADPLAALRTTSRDLTFREEIPLRRGDRLTALDIQHAYCDRARRYLDERGGPAHLAEVVEAWGDTLDKLRDDWRRLSTRLDWAIKRGLLDRYLQNSGCDWPTVGRWMAPLEEALSLESPGAAAAGPAPEAVRREGLDWSDCGRMRALYFTLRKLDLDYHDTSRGEGAGPAGLFSFLQQRGVVERLVSDEEILRRVESAPADTRAYLRGYCLSRFGDRVEEADWAELRFGAAAGGPGGRLALPDPTAGTEAQLRDLLAGGPDLPALLRHGAGEGPTGYDDTEEALHG
jgi:proteasome accessory factor A